MTERMKYPRLARWVWRGVLGVFVLMVALSGDQGVTAIASTATADRNVLRTGRLGYTELDEQKVRERLEMGQVAGEVGFTAAADLAGRLGLKEGRKHSCAV